VKRGDLVTVSLRGEQGKPRPALIIQSDLFDGGNSVTVLPLTSTLVDAPWLRVPVEPSPLNGLTQRSQIMIDKAQTPGLDRIGEIIGRLDIVTKLAVDRALAVFLRLV
jgi:mRNA interferase MazF